MLQLMYLSLCFLLCAIKDVAAGKLSPTDTLTWGEDNSRSGYGANHNMDPSVVGSAQFGQLWTTKLPGNYNGALEQIYSQPLVYTLDDGIQYVFIATTQNNVYKINAKTGDIVASRNLHIPFLSSDVVPCTDINPLIGVTATGVIDSTTDTWYITAKTYDDQTDQVKGRTNGRYFFHAIDVNTLAEKPGFPKGLEGTVARNNVNRNFNGGIHHQRPALLLTGNYVYAGFASHCVQYNFTGWIMGFDKTSGSIVERFTTEGGPEANSVPGGGVWMSGGGIATDNKGSMYFSTGNGYASQLHGTPVPGRQPPTSLEEAAVNMKINDDGSLTVVDFFMPWEKEQLDGADKDLGTTPLELLPPSTFTCPNAKRMGVVTGKSGKTYFLNLDNLGGYQMGVNKLDAIPQQPIQNENSVYAGAGILPLDGGYVYINVIQYQTHVFKFSCDASGNPAFTKVADTPEKAAYVLGVGHGTTTSLNGQSGTGLYWMTDVDGYNLRIYNAVPQSGSLQLIKTANIPGVTKFARPVFGDGRAYVGTLQGLLYAFGSPVNLPLTCTSPNDFGKTSINSTSAVKTIQCQANTYTQVKAITLKNTANFQISGLPSLPVDVAAGTNISFQAVFAPTAPGPLSVDVSVNTSSGDTKYSSNTPVSLKGVGTSASPLFAVNPNTVSFTGVIVGQTDGGATESLIFSNVGDGNLTVQGLDYSIISETGAYVQPNVTADGVQVGPFTFISLPTTIAGNTDAIVKVNFNPVATGNYAVYIHVRTDGGTKIIDVFGTASSYPTALLEFEAADGSGRWIPYTSNNPPFTFGDVYEQTTKSLRMRLTNNGSSSAGSLSVTVSKPPFGVPGIVGAQNGADLGEGTNLAAGQSATAVLFCSVPKSQVNVDTYNGTATWVMNTGDPNFGKQQIQFFCNAVAEQVGPLAANGSAVYRYGGCYKENNPGRQLSVQIYGNDPDMDNDKCIAGCAAQGYAIAASEYTNECFCGKRFPIQLGNETDCNYQCTGNSTQTCGGNGYFHDHSYMSLFSNGKALPPLPNVPTSVMPSYGAYNYSGCYTEGTGGRALSDKQTASTDMTVAYCGDFCAGYNFFGIEYSSECYCGNTIANAATKAAEGDCSMTCSGNSTQYCGGGQRLTVYGTNVTASAASSSSSSTGTATAAPSGTSSSTSTPSAPVAVPTASGFAYQGCYTEGASGRALGDSATAYSGMTVEKCAAFCSGYAYMGVEYSSECYCGNTIGAGAALATDNGCSMTCSGNAGEFCGGPNRINFYKQGNNTSSTVISTTTSSTSTGTSKTSSTTSATTTGPAAVQTAGTFAFQGCYSEGTSGRALADTNTASSTMSVEVCAAFCKGYSYMAVEYSSECYCGNTIAAGSALVTDNGCTMTCSGAPSEFCGGPNRLNFYKQNATAVGPSTISATSQTSTSSTSTSSTVPATPTGPMTVQRVGGYGFLGCYNEVENGRALTDLMNPISGDKVSIENCAAACSAYTYFGVEYAAECYCGNAIQAGSALVAGSDPSVTQCNMPCNANQTEYCGGPARLNMYKKGLVSTSTSSTTSKASPTSTSLSAASTSKVSSTTSSSAASTLKVPSTTSSSAASTSKVSSTTSSAATTSKSSTLTTSSQTSTITSSSLSSTSTSTAKSSSSSSTSQTSRIASSSSSTSKSSTTSSTSSTSTSATTGPTIVPGNTNFTYTACWDEPSSGRALPTLALASDSMTVELCLSKCYNYQYAGIEYGRECWCGNTLASTSAQATAESQCNKKCPGDNSEICGAGLRLTLYTHNAASAPKANFALAKAAATSSTLSSSSAATSSTQTPSITSSQSSSTSTKTSKSSSSSSSSTLSTIYPTASATLGKFTYAGCANTTSPLALNGLNLTSSDMDIETCTDYCSKNNYGLSGLSNSDTCYCGNGLQSFSAIQLESSGPSSSKCNQPCAGNSTEICGAQSYLSVWNATATIAPTVVKQVGYYPLKGCFNSTAANLTASTTTISSLTAESCVGYCNTRGYAVAGISNGNTCACDSSLPSTAKTTDLSNCNVRCIANGREFCGAKATSLVYVYDGASVDGNGVPKSIGQDNTASITPAS
ncbi:MAG: hypothetical protein Q9218_005195 [Villophora microphyllina]